MRRDDRAYPSHLHLESGYLSPALVLSFDAPGAHAVSVLVDGTLDQEAARARLLVDPNVCDLDATGARIACTHLAPRSYAIALTRLRSQAPAGARGTRYAITGAGLRDGLTLVVSPRDERFHIELGDALATLRRRGRGPRPGTPEAPRPPGREGLRERAELPGASRPPWSEGGSASITR